jgi:hypothetical protein
MTDDADDDPGFFRSLRGLARDWVQERRRALAAEPQTNVDSETAGTGYSFSGQQTTFEELRDIKRMRESGGTVAQLMDQKALLNFGEGAELQVEDDEETEQEVDGEPMTLSEWLTAEAFPNLDLLVLDLGGDALWYPAAVGEFQETQTGGFKRVLPAEPWTIKPITDERGTVEAYRQRTKAPSGGYQEQTLAEDDLWHIVVNKSSARDETGISEVLRNSDEIQAYKENEGAIRQAIELHGFPQRHVKVGREEGAPVSDDDLRRVRTIFDPRTTDANTAYFTGRDVDVDTLEAQNFDYGAVHEMDMRNLTTALGLPLEAGNVGSDGLGSGKPAELRFALLKLAIQANQRSFATQFVDRVVRPVVRDYSPFDHRAEISMTIDDPLEDVGETADLINKVGGLMTNAEKRRRLDLPEPEDDDVAESYRTPADIEAAEAGEEGAPDEPLAGLFSDDGDDRTLADPMTNGHQLDPETGVGVCEQTGEKITAETMGDLTADCPHCGDALSVLNEDKSLADIPEKFTDGTGLSEDDFVPTADVERVVEDVLAFIDEEGLPNPENQREGATRANQLKDHAANDDPLAVEFWQEISNFHARHRAQGNHECDESDLPEKAAESEFDDCYFDPGYFSDKTWGGDPGKEQADRIVEAIESTEGVSLSSAGGGTGNRPRCLGGVTDRDLQHAPEWDAPLLEMYRGVTDPESDPSRTLVSFAASEAPEFVLERIRDAVDQGAMFSEFDGISSDRQFQLREQFKSVLGTDDFTLDTITESIMDFAELSRDDAERIARTESSAVLNKAREIGFEEREETDDLFYWTGADPGDDRQTEACEWLIRQTNPFHGGEPVGLKELRELVDEAPQHDDSMNNALARPQSWVVHPNERSTFAKAPPSWRDL